MKSLPGLIFSLSLLIPGSGLAQSTTWDVLLTDSEWYVPAANLLAYVTSDTAFNNPLPIGDQTLWEIGTTTNGTFTGTSTATFQLGPSAIESTTTMNGLITDAGQVRIAFSSATAPTTMGIGQVRDLGGETYIQMQMMTGTGDVFITHWAYMAKADGGPPVNGPALVSPQWNWMVGTSWDFSGWELDGTVSAGTFMIEDYVNGYFWGSGSSQDGAFALIGSATPEGNILFNTLAGSTFTSLTGMIQGDATNGQMALRSYNTDNSFGTLGLANVIPEPSTVGLLVLAAFGSLCPGRKKS